MDTDRIWNNQIVIHWKDIDVNGALRTIVALPFFFFAKDIHQLLLGRRTEIKGMPNRIFYSISPVTEGQPLPLKSNT